jgi:hypothetical protein
MKEMEEHLCPYCNTKRAAATEKASLFSLFECRNCRRCYGIAHSHDGTDIVKFDQSNSLKQEGGRCVVDWSQTRDGELVFIGASRTTTDTDWRFTERSTWEVRWYQIHASPQLISIADKIRDFHLIKSAQA